MRKKIKNKEKKVYKTDKNLLKKIGRGILAIFGVVLIIFGVKIFIDNSWKWHEINEYDFKIKLPKAYEEIEFVSEKDKYGIASSAFETETTIEVNEEYVSKKPKVVYNGRNVKKGVSMMVQCLKTEKTSKSLDEIAEGNYVLTTICYENNYQIGTFTKEYVKVLETDAVKTVVNISNDEGEKTIVTYLVPMNDKEITMTFMGKKSNIDKAMDEIEKIADTMK